MLNTKVTHSHVNPRCQSKQIHTQFSLTIIIPFSLQLKKSVTHSNCTTMILFRDSQLCNFKPIFNHKRFRLKTLYAHYTHTQAKIDVLLSQNTSFILLCLLPLHASLEEFIKHLQKNAT